MMSLTNNAYVYCTDCRYFKLRDDELFGKNTPYCDRPTKEYCNDWDMDDSKPYSERPFYREYKV